MEPYVVKWNGSPWEAHDAALRTAVSLGFDVILSDKLAGALRVEITSADKEGTARIEQERLEIWNSLTPEEQWVAVRQNRLVARGAYLTRKLTISVAASPGEVLVVPAVQACLNDGVRVQCSPRPGLLPDEARAGMAISTAILETSVTAKTKTTRGAEL